MILSGREAAAIDAYCPFGAVESALTLIFTGGYLPRLHLSTFLIFGAVVLTIFLANKGFCSWICPLGSFQEWISKLAKKLKIKQIKVNQTADKYLRLLKYVLLIIIIYYSFKLTTLVFRIYDPFVVLFHFGEGLLYDFEAEKLLGYTILGIVILSSLFIERFWCKYACPLGAKLNIISLLSFNRIKRDEKTCTKCSACNRGCPMNIKIMETKKIINPECINCLKCITNCPKGSLTLNLEGYRK
jgi:NapH/MauN family ferredoxin-type protein